MNITLAESLFILHLNKLPAIEATEVLTIVNIAELVADLLCITNGCLLVVLNILVLFEDLEHAIESLAHCSFAVLRVEIDGLVAELLLNGCLKQGCICSINYA